MVGSHRLFWWAPGILLAGHPSLILVGMCCFSGQMEFSWACRFCFGGHLAFLLLAMCHLAGHVAFLLLDTYHLAGYLTFFLVPNWHLDRQPDLIWWTHGVLVSPWHLYKHTAFLWLCMWHSVGHTASSWAPSVSFGGHLEFLLPRGILLGTQHTFL